MTDSASESIAETPENTIRSRQRLRLHKHSDSTEGDLSSSGADNNGRLSPQVPLAIAESPATISSSQSPTPDGHGKKNQGNSKARRRGSGASSLSVDLREGSRGIKIGAGRPVGGVLTSGPNMIPTLEGNGEAVSGHSKARRFRD